jgi:hypothetical protein
MRNESRRPARAVLCVAISAALGVGGVGGPPGLSAHAQDARLVELLTRDRDFRVRVQAAFSMGATGQAAYVPALIGALDDANPAVRAAAASALSRIGDRSAIPALRRLSRDPSASVRLQSERAIASIEAASRTGVGRGSGVAATAGSAQPGAAGDAAGAARPFVGRPGDAPGSVGAYLPISVVPSVEEVQWNTARWVVVLGAMNNRSGFAGDDLALKMRNEVERHLRNVRGVAVVAEGDERANREARRRRLSRVLLEGSLAKIERRQQASELQVRCEVNLMLLDDERNMRGALSGAATGVETLRGPRPALERRLAEQALEGAVRGAMRDVPGTLARVAR